MKGIDLNHLKEVEEGYFEHMMHSAKYSLVFACCSAFCLFHAIFPFFFVDYASKKAEQIVNNVNERRN
tara:strand:+ start:411 stop:614 length:204 start_codon:yes stop_codon:yes gene_type:complete